MVLDGVLKKNQTNRIGILNSTSKKPNGKIRICMDPRSLNKYIKREHYQLPTIDNILAEIGNAKIFTVFDASFVFLQICLNESTKICTI